VVRNLGGTGMDESFDQDGGGWISETPLEVDFSMGEIKLRERTRTFKDGCIR